MERLVFRTSLGLRSQPFIRSRTLWQRRVSSQTSASPESKTESKYMTRLKRMNEKLPRFLRYYTTPLLSAPVSHVTSFLILHEITAMVPLIGLAAFFHYYQWLPEQVVHGKLVQAGVEKWGRYFQRKGWVEGGPDSAKVAESEQDPGSRGIDVSAIENRGAGWNVVIEVASAWAVVKALLPVRILACVWLTPGFAKFAVIPAMRILGKAGSKAV